MQRAFAAETFEEEKAAIIRACSDSEKVQELVQQLARASPGALSDDEVAESCVGVRGHLLQHFSEPLRADRRLVLAAVSQDGCAILYASDELRQDKEVVLAAVSNNGQALLHVSAKLREDKEVVLAAVGQDGSALMHANDELGGDKEVVLTALRTDSFALLFAKQELRADKEVVLAAVRRTSRALQGASEDLRNDKDFVLLAARHSSGSSFHSIYDKAGPTIKDAMSEEQFCLAAESALAVPGQPDAAPTVTVALARHSSDHGNGDSDCFHAEASFGLSGEQLVCDIPVDTRASGPILDDLAKELVATLQEAGKVGQDQKHIFINFLTGDVDDLFAVTPWDSQLPLSQFLASKP